MKIICIVVAAIIYIIGEFSVPTGFQFVLLITLAFATYGIVRSRRRKIDPYNDLPNALRVLLASAGGSLIAVDKNFVPQSAGILLICASILLNDEYQRRTLDSLLKGRRGGSIAFLGIDGSGKSSHASTTRRWLEERGYRSIHMPFHRYIFVERLSRRGVAPRNKRTRGNPIRPLFSLVDNLLLQLFSSFGCRLEGTVVLYDRFLWSTYIKYFALGYPVRPISSLYLLPRPRFAIVLDVPVEKSLNVIYSRESHIRYRGSVLQKERELYLKIARERGYPVIDSTKDPEAVQAQIERYLSRLFPIIGGSRAL